MISCDFLVIIAQRSFPKILKETGKIPASHFLKTAKETGQIPDCVSYQAFPKTWSRTVWR